MRNEYKELDEEMYQSLEKIDQLLKRREGLERVRKYEQKLRDTDSLQASKKQLMYCYKEIDNIDIELNKLDPVRFELTEDLKETIKRTEYIDKLLKENPPKFFKNK